MFEVFKKYLTDKMLLTEQDFTLISAHCTLKVIPKKQFLLKAGEVWKYDAFICRGLLKYYYLDLKGHEHIMQFAPENHWIGDRESMETELPSKYNIDAIEDSEILLIKKHDFEMLRKTIPVFNDFVNETMKKNVQALQSRIHENAVLSSEEKYYKFLKQSSSVANRIPQLMVASYLGITPESLSRIRAISVRK